MQWCVYSATTKVNWNLEVRNFRHIDGTLYRWSNQNSESKAPCLLLARFSCTWAVYVFFCKYRKCELYGQLFEGKLDNIFRPVKFLCWVSWSMDQNDSGIYYEWHSLIDNLEMNKKKHRSISSKYTNNKEHLFMRFRCILHLNRWWPHSLILFTIFTKELEFICTHFYLCHFQWEWSLGAAYKDSLCIRKIVLNVLCMELLFDGAFDEDSYYKINLVYLEKAFRSIHNGI